MGLSVVRHLRVAPLAWAMMLSVVLAGCEAGAPSDSGPAPTASGGSTPTVSTPGTVASPGRGSASTLPFPPGLDDAISGQFYAESDGAVLRVDLRARSVQHIATPRLESFRSFVATRRFLVVKHVDDAAGFVVTPDGGVGGLPSALGGPGRLYASGPDGIWVVPEEATNGHRPVSQFSTASSAPKLLGRRTIPAALGIPWSDETGQLLAGGTNLVYRVTRSSTKRLLRWRRGGELLGIGRTAMVVKPCPRCDVVQRNRGASDRKGRATARGLAAVDELIATHGYSADGLVSPSGRFMAMSITMKDDRRNSRLAVTDLVTGTTVLVPGSMTRFNPNDQVAWLSRSDDRWLLAVTDQTLRILDTTTGTVHTWRDTFVDRIAVVR